MRSSSSADYTVTRGDGPCPASSPGPLLPTPRANRKTAQALQAGAPQDDRHTRRAWIATTGGAPRACGGPARRSAFLGAVEVGRDACVAVVSSRHAACPRRTRGLAREPGRRPSGPRRLAPGWTARWRRHGRASSSQYESSPAITALLRTGQEPRRLFCCLSLIPGRRSARRRRARHAACKNGRTERTAVVAGRAPGSATYALLSVKGRSGAPRAYPKSRALVRGHARAHPRGAPAKCAGARLPLKARALDVRSYVPLHPGILAFSSAAGRRAACSIRAWQAA